MSKQYPRGKLNDDDEGAMAVAVSIFNRTVIVNFGSPVAWIGLPKKEAIEFANLILEKANQI